MNEPPPRQVRSDEETLGEIFNGSPYAVDADVDPHADWVPRAEQVFDEKKLMQLSIWKKYWDEDEKAYEAIDLAYKPYGPQQTREWSKLGYLDEKGHLRTERELIESGALTDETQVANWHKKVALVKLLRDANAFDKRLSKTDAELIFVRAAQAGSAKGGRSKQVAYPQFLEALYQLAAHRSNPADRRSAIPPTGRFRLPEFLAPFIAPIP